MENPRLCPPPGGLANGFLTAFDFDLLHQVERVTEAGSSDVR